VRHLLQQLRRHVARYALAVALCQLAVLCASTITVAASARSAALAVSAGEACSCEHTAGVMCPMHRKSSPRPAPANTPRWCKGVDGSSYAVLPAFGALGLPEGITQLLLPITEGFAPAVHADAPRALHSPPDSPPPRA
jgi:hypothetical protein